ncbi:unnamed protein product [Coffea canephora]|uniref:Uncharacterized protein n=1 Tax=Coffea canephora TaxID=49390 RepID=A0A068U2K5_COFCA|nr:unnamed protein product [Coffea canephora]
MWGGLAFKRALAALLAAWTREAAIKSGIKFLLVRKLRAFMETETRYAYQSNYEPLSMVWLW